MIFSTTPNTPTAKPSPPRLTCRANLWQQILRELKSRGAGRRESGGFLLGQKSTASREIIDFLAYDDVDPKCLRGMIVFDGSQMDKVWAYCRAKKLDVVADVHTHPAGYGQSRIDQANPMMPELGHIALIIPNYADRAYGPGDIGMYEFRGRDGWLNHSRLGASFFSLTGTQ